MCLTCGHNDPASASSSSDVSSTGCSTCICERALSIGPVVTTTLSPDYTSSCAPRNDEQRNRKKQACIFGCSDCEMEGAGSNPGASSYSGDFSHFLRDTWTTDNDLDDNTPIPLSSLFANNDVNYYFPPRPHSHTNSTLSHGHNKFPNPEAREFVPRPVPRPLSSSSSSSSGNDDDDDDSLFQLIFETTHPKYDNSKMDLNNGNSSSANASRSNKTPSSSSPPASSNNDHQSHGPTNSSNRSSGFPYSHSGSISSPIPISTTSSSSRSSTSAMSYDTTDASTTTTSSASSSSSASGDNDNDDFAITYCPTPNRGAQCPIMDYFRGEPSSSNSRKDSFNAVISQIRKALCELRPLDNKRYCKFCKTNKEHFRVFASHVTKDASDKVVCPILMQYVCPLCGARGSNAHTAKYCPLKEFDVVDAMDRMLQE